MPSRKKPAPIYRKEDDIASLEAQHLREGMMLITPAYGRCRVSHVHKTKIGVYHIRFDTPFGKGEMGRGRIDTVLVDASDLPTALILATKEFPWTKVGDVNRLAQGLKDYLKS